LLPSSTMDGALAVAERLRQLVASQAVPFEGKQIEYTISAGIAASTGEPVTLETLMKQADQALYAAKGNGRNRVETWSANGGVA
jgi:diguanylate cyclase (GGDEF)-like protein